MALAYHLMLRLQNGQTIATTPEERRILARTVLGCARDSQLLAFSQADTHLHGASACDRPKAGRLAHDIETSLRWRLRIQVPFAPATIKPIEDVWHLYNTFRYILRQPERHGIALDPLREASNLPDLLGLRLLGSGTAIHVRRLLPRVTREELLALYAIPRLEPASEPLDLLVPATLAAAALPSFSGFGAEENAARRAAIEVAAGRLRAGTLAAMLGIGRRTFYTCRAMPVDGALVLAVRRQLHLLGQRDWRETERAFDARVA
jgi:hypothetical protein